MDWETFKAIVADGGGFQNIALLVFDNSILVLMTKANGGRCSEKDFKKFGNEYCYKEPVIVRDSRTGEYTITMTNYHPLSCLQSVVMGKDMDNIIMEDVNDLM